jgi:glycylpeptide N-tetradecanoyltransferase
LPSSILKSRKYKTIHAAYSYYNVGTTETFSTLMRNSLILAKLQDFDVFNALDILDNKKAFEELIFHSGSGNLNYYIYNWNISSHLEPTDLGIVLL